MRHSTPVLAAVALLVVSWPARANEVGGLIARGDDAYDRRADGARDGVAAPVPIAQAVAAFEAALAAAPDRLDVRVQLLRALFFQAEYAIVEPKERRAVFDAGRRLFDDGLEQLAARGVGRKALDKMSSTELAAAFADVPDAGPLYFWGAVHWGKWGEYFGKMASVRKGVAGKIRDFGEAAIALDEDYEFAGGHRLIGRLHALAPRVPLFTGWVRREQAVSSLERAVELAADDYLNRLFLAEALLEFVPARRAEAMLMLRQVCAAAPRPGREVEDAQALTMARQRLAEIEGG